MRQYLLPLTLVWVLAACTSTDRMTRSSRLPILTDEYALLDTSSLDRPDDKVLRRKLDEARRHYLLALKASDQGKDAVASQHFEASMNILNDLVTYPDIYANPDFTRLSESLIRDYEEKVTSIDSLDPNSSFFVLRDKMYQEIERLPVQRQRYPAASRRHVGSDSPSEAAWADYGIQIALTDNTPVQQCIAFFTSEKGRKFFSRWLARTGKYFPLYEQVLEEEGVPLELKHLSMIESGLNPTAVSWAKAVGLWQFIPSTGQMYGLAINWWVDERRDPTKATRAAARYLKDLYTDLGDWHLALAAYNCGPGRVKSAISKANSRDYWVVRNYLPRETQQYVPLFIAATKITLEPEAYGFTNIEYENPLDYRIAPLKGSFDIATIATAANTTVDRIRELNPELLRDRIPSGDANGYPVRIPIESRADVASILNDIPAPVQPTVTFVTHKVKRGESLTEIADEYGTSIEDICSANRISPKANVRRGARLRIPILNTASNRESDSTATLIASTDTPPAATTAATRRHAGPVTPVDQGISPEKPSTPEERAFVSALGPRSTGGSQSVTTGAPAVAQSRTASATKPAAHIRAVSARRHDDAAEATPKIHTVARGETLTGIARRYRVSARDLAAWNGLPRNYEVKTGERLRLSSSGSVTRSSDIAVRSDRPATSSKASRRTTPTTRYETHRVRRGESLTGIAERYGVSVDDLRAWNHGAFRGGTLLSGTSLRVYGDSPSKGDSRRTSRASRSAPKSYTVRRGDSLQDIANRFGVSLRDLKANNPRLRSGKLQAGQRIRIGR